MLGDAIIAHAMISARVSEEAQEFAGREANAAMRALLMLPQIDAMPLQERPRDDRAGILVQQHTDERPGGLPGPQVWRKA